MKKENIIGTLVVAAVLTFVSANVAMAAVWTDLADYSPGSTVTIHGDNSNGAGYLPGETVTVSVTGPTPYYSQCSGTVDATGAWSCTVTLASDLSAEGSYTYTAVGQTSLVTESGTFTDSGSLSYSPLTQGLTITAGSSGSFTQTVTAPKNNGVFTASLDVAPTGANPIPSSWVSVSPSSLSFTTTSTLGDTKSWVVTFAVPPGTAAGIYTAQIKAKPSVTGVGVGAGTAVTLTVTSPVTPASAPTVTKDATPSFTRTFTWGIDKSVDTTTQDIASGGSASFGYTVSVTHDPGTDSAWQVTGTITVDNPNADSITGVTIDDSVDNGGSCSVSGFTGTLISGSSSYSYSCTYSSKPTSSSGTNTVKITWPTQTLLPSGEPLSVGSASFTTPIFDFSTTSPTIVDGSVSVTDSLEGALGSVSYTETSPKTFTYSKSLSGVAGTCTNYPNTATFTTNTNGVTGSASQSVQVCVGADLTVSKDATPTFTRTFAWSITKTVDKPEIDTSGSATFNYDVGVTHDSGTDSAWQVSGKIHVVNPNDWEPITADVTDSTDVGGTCTVTGGSSVTVPKSGSVDLDYSCTYASAPSPTIGTNTGTAAWDKSVFSTPDASASGAAAIDFSTPTTTVDGGVTVTDTLGGTLGTASSTDSSPKTFTYSQTFTDAAGTCTSHDNTATFKTDTTGTTGSASQTVKVCVGADLTVSKTATPSFTRTFAWSITKTVDKSEIDTSGSATFNYDVGVTHDSTDSAWQVAGTITVTNPNDWETITLSNIADAINNGGTCTVTPGAMTVPASSSISFTYRCTYSSAPSPSSGTNTGTAAWDSATYFTPSGSADGSAGIAFTTPTTTVDGSVSVTDTIGGTLGTVLSTDSSPTTFTYSKTFTDTAGTCTGHDNTATFTTDTNGATGSSSQSVKVCVGADLTVTKTATPSYTRTYNWGITKIATTPLIEQFGGTANLGYTVNAAETGFTDSAWQVAGTITVNNPNDWEAITANVADTIDNGGSCTVTGSPASVPVGGTVSLPYNCTYALAPSPSLSGTNTGKATVTSGITPSSSISGSATYDFSSVSPATVDKTITVTDAFNGGAPTTLGTTPAATDSTPYTSVTYTVPETKSVTAGTCVNYPNTATISETGVTSTASVTVCGTNTGALTMGYWQNKNGQAIITGGASTAGVANSGTWLRQFAPFQDIPSTATTTQVASYVTNVIKNANAAGATMNAMLKGQMLATALDVYFSDPVLGGNKIGVAMPIGGLNIDLTKICSNPTGTPGTCGSVTPEDDSSAFGGSPQTVSQMLTYAASKAATATIANPLASPWYGQNKATQQLAKDAFNAINNQDAFII